MLFPFRRKISYVYLYLYLIFIHKSTNWIKDEASSQCAKQDTINQSDVHLAYIACGTQTVRQVVISMKSAVTCAKYNEHRRREGVSHQLGQLHIHIISDHKLDLCNLGQAINAWPRHVRATFKISYHLVKRHRLKAWFRFRCAEQKLFLHTILPPEVDSVISFDADFVFFSDPRLLWLQTFPHMSRFQLVGATKDYYGHEINPLDRHIPVYKKEEGVNTGVLVLNLTRIRDKGDSWLSDLEEIQYQYPRLVLPEQSLLNIYLSSRPELVYPVDCSWGYIYWYCHLEDYCPNLEQHPVIHALHGGMGSFRSFLNTPWSLSYSVWRKFEMGSNPQRYVVDELRRILPSPMPQCYTSVDLTQAFTV